MVAFEHNHGLLARTTVTAMSRIEKNPALYSKHTRTAIRNLWQFRNRTVSVNVHGKEASLRLGEWWPYTVLHSVHSASGYIKARMIFVDSNWQFLISFLVPLFISFFAYHCTHRKIRKKIALCMRFDLVATVRSPESCAWIIPFAVRVCLSISRGAMRSHTLWCCQELFFLCGSSHWQNFRPNFRTNGAVFEFFQLFFVQNWKKNEFFGSFCFKSKTCFTEWQIEINLIR